MAGPCSRRAMRPPSAGRIAGIAVPAAPVTASTAAVPTDVMPGMRRMSSMRGFNRIAGIDIYWDACTRAGSQSKPHRSRSEKVSRRRSGRARPRRSDGVSEVVYRPHIWTGHQDSEGTCPMWACGSPVANHTGDAHAFIYATAVRPSCGSEAGPTHQLLHSGGLT